MQVELVVLLVMLVVGIFQGLMVCNLTCGPLLFLRLAGRGGGAKEGLRLSLMFSFPRIIILTVLGALLGAVGYTAGTLAGLSSFPWFSGLVYLLIALVMISTGVSFLRKRDRRTCGSGGTFRGKAMSFLMGLGPKRGRGEGRAMFGLGMLVSLLCFVEASAASLVVASFLGLDSADLGSGILFGASSMMAYSIGLAVPLVALGTGASEIGRRLNTDDVRIVGGLLLLVLGTILMIYEIAVLIMNI